MLLYFLGSIWILPESFPNNNNVI